MENVLKLVGDAASHDQERLLKLWDYDEGVCKYIGVGHSGSISATAIAPDQSYVVSVGTSISLLVYAGRTMHPP